MCLHGYGFLHKHCSIHKHIQLHWECILSTGYFPTSSLWWELLRSESPFADLFWVPLEPIHSLPLRCPVWQALALDYWIGYKLPEVRIRVVHSSWGTPTGWEHSTLTKKLLLCSPREASSSVDCISLEDSSRQLQIENPWALEITRQGRRQGQYMFFCSLKFVLCNNRIKGLVSVNVTL